MSGGLDIRFFGRESRKRGVREETLQASCHELARDVLDLLLDHPEVAELTTASGHHQDLLMEVLGENLRIVALEHKHCGWDDRGYEKCPVPDITDATLHEAYRELHATWGTTTEVFLDTLCVHVQARDLRNHARWYAGPGAEPTEEMQEWADNRKRRDELIILLEATLRSHGFHVTSLGEVVLAEHAGTQAEIEQPSLEALDRAGWTDVSAKLREAAREIDEGSFADAITDVGTGLQRAFARAGYQGGTLGKQIAAAGGKSMTKTRGTEEADATGRGSASFAGVHTRLADVAYHLSEWLASVRNQISDAHHGPEATQHEAELALRTGLALAVWIADSRSGVTVERQAAD